jgi:hypothetical protein
MYLPIDDGHLKRQQVVLDEVIANAKVMTFLQPIQRQK